MIRATNGGWFADLYFLMDSLASVHGDSDLQLIHRVSLVDRYLESCRGTNSLNFIV